MKKLNIHFLIIALAFTAACNSSNNKEKANDDSAVVEKAEVTENTAVAEISSASGSSLTGEATFTDLGEGEVTFKITVEGATPGEHAVHLHEKGDCSATDATSAGGHWNPTEAPHGKRPVDMKFHAGDIANIEVGEDGKGELTMTVTGWSVGGSDSTNVIDRAVVIHAQADDFESQPSGAAGKRVGCGVIKKG